MRSSGSEVLLLSLPDLSRAHQIDLDGTNPISPGPTGSRVIIPNKKNDKILCTLSGT
jgi:hypothetical protein